MNFLAMMKAVFAVFISLFMALSPGGFPRVPHGKDFKLVRRVRREQAACLP